MHISTLFLLSTLATPGLCAIGGTKPIGGGNTQQAKDDIKNRLTEAAGMNYTTVADVITSFPSCSQFCVAMFFDAKLDSCGYENTNLYSAVESNKTSSIDADPSKINWPCLCQAKQTDGTFDESKKKVESLNQALTCVKNEQGIRSNDSQCLQTEEVARIGIAYTKFTKWCEMEGHSKAEVKQNGDESIGTRMGGAVNMIGGLAVLGAFFLML